MSARTEAEIASQPEMWRRAAQLAADVAGLPEPGEKVAVIGCGTSWFIAQAYANLRERAGQGLTDAFTATEALLGRGYDRIVLLSRSGTTTEILDVARTTSVPATLVTAVGEGPVAEHVEHEVVLDFADEESVVQTRFATSALALFRASLGESLEQAAADAEQAISAQIDDHWVSAEQITFLGTGWTIGLAAEAALKLREAAQSWTESYPAMEYRHGPMAIAEPGRVVWVFGSVPEGLADQVAATGALFTSSDLDPMAHLVLAQRLAVARARARGLNADQPRSLSRSVILYEG